MAKLLALQCVFFCLLLCLVGLARIAQGSDALTPIVDVASGQLYGAVSGTDWLPAEDAAAQIKQNLTGFAYTSAGVLLSETTLSQVETNEICSNPTYRPTGSALPQAATWVGAAWDAAPRKPIVLKPDSAVYRKLVATWLREQGITDAQPKLSQLWRVDLEGDGRDEVLMAAARHRGSATSTAAGDYSILLLRKLIDDQDVATLAIYSNIYPEECIAECALATHEIVGALDFNGDGSLEIISKSMDYESVSQAIHSLEGTQLEKRLDWFCGS